MLGPTKPSAGVRSRESFNQLTLLPHFPCDSVGANGSKQVNVAAGNTQLLTGLGALGNHSENRINLGRQLRHWVNELLRHLPT
jgi:hypothetical protein